LRLEREGKAREEREKNGDMNTVAQTGVSFSYGEVVEDFEDYGTGGRGFAAGTFEGSLQ